MRPHTLFISALAAIVVIIAAGCGSDDEPTAGDAQLGALEIKHSFTTKALVFPFTSENPVNTPAAGNELALVVMTIVNESGQELIIGPANFQLEADDGSRYTYKFNYEGKNIIPAVSTLGPGQSITGSIAFEVPSGATLSMIVERFDGDEKLFELPAPRQGA